MSATDNKNVNIPFGIDFWGELCQCNYIPRDMPDTCHQKVSNNGVNFKNGANNVNKTMLRPKIKNQPEPHTLNSSYLFSFVPYNCNSKLLLNTNEK